MTTPDRIEVEASPGRRFRPRAYLAALLATGAIYLGVDHLLVFEWMAEARPDRSTGLDTTSQPDAPPPDPSASGPSPAE